MKIQAYIADTEGEPIVVTTADMTTDDGSPCVTIDHEDHRLIVSADALRAAIQRARIDKRYDDEIAF